jgi:hypothetical protein
MGLAIFRQRPPSQLTIGELRRFNQNSTVESISNEFGTAASVGFWLVGLFEPVRKSGCSYAVAGAVGGAA